MLSFNVKVYLTWNKIPSSLVQKQKFHRSPANFQTTSPLPILNGHYFSDRFWRIFNSAYLDCPSILSWLTPKVESILTSGWGRRNLNFQMSHEFCYPRQWVWIWCSSNLSKWYHQFSVKMPIAPPPLCVWIKSNPHSLKWVNKNETPPFSSYFIHTQIQFISWK